jgi:hypothetical protein
MPFLSGLVLVDPVAKWVESHDPGEKNPGGHRVSIVITIPMFLRVGFWLIGMVRHVI